MNFCMNHTPGAGSITGPVDLQPSTLPMCQGSPITFLFWNYFFNSNNNIPLLMAIQPILMNFWTKKINKFRKKKKILIFCLKLYWESLQHDLSNYYSDLPDYTLWYKDILLVEYHYNFPALPKWMSEGTLNLLTLFPCPSSNKWRVSSVHSQ